MKTRKRVSKEMSGPVTMVSWLYLGGGVFAPVFE